MRKHIGSYKSQMAKVMSIPVLTGLIRARGATAVVMIGMLIQQSFAFLSGIIIAHAVGSTGYGTSNILRNMLAAGLTLAPIGLDLALLKYGPRFPDRSTFVKQTSRLRLVVATVNLSVLLIVWGFLGHWLEEHVYHIVGFRNLLLVTLIGLPIAADLAILSSIYKVDDQPARYALMSTWLQPPIRLMGAIFALLFHWGVMSIILSGTVAYVVSAVCIAFDRSRRSAKEVTVLPAVAKVDPGGLVPTVDMGNWGYLGVVLRDSGWMAVSLFAYGALRFVDILVLGAYAPVQIVGAYGALSTISQLVAAYPMAMSQTLGPNISRHYHNGDLPGLRRALNQFIQKASIVGGFIFGGIASFGDHLDLIFGKTFLFDPILAFLLPLGWFVSATLAPTSYALSMTGHHRSELRVLLLGMVVLLIGCLLLVPKFGGVGAATAVLVTFLVIDITRFAMVSRIFGFFPGRLFDIISPAVAALIGYTVKWLSDISLGRSFIALVAACTIYSIIFGGASIFLSRYARR